MHIDELMESIKDLRKKQVESDIGGKDGVDNYKFDLRKIRYVDNFDEYGIKLLIKREFVDSDMIDKDIELYKMWTMNCTRPYLFRTISAKDATAILNCDC